MANNKRVMGYQEQAFRERAGIAQAQYEELAAEQGILSRQSKQQRRADFKQQRQREKTKVMHVAQLGYFRRVPKAGGTVVTRGGGQGMGMTGTPGGLTPTEKAKIKAGRQVVERSGMSAGGVAQVGAAQRWTTSGWKEAKPGEDVSLYKSQEMAKIRERPLHTAFSLKPKSDVTLGLSQRAGAPTKLKQKAKQSQLKRQARKEQLEKVTRVREVYGEEGANLVLAEWQKRLAKLMGE